MHDLGQVPRFPEHWALASSSVKWGNTLFLGPHPNHVYSPLFSACSEHLPHPLLPGLLAPFWLGLANGKHWQEMEGGGRDGLGYFSPDALSLLWPSSRAQALSPQVHGSCWAAPPHPSSDFLPASAPGQVTAPHGGWVPLALPSWSALFPSSR